MPFRKASIACVLTFVGAGRSQDIATENAAIAVDDKCNGDEVCAWNALQLRGTRSSSVPGEGDGLSSEVATEAMVDCHDVQPGEVGLCMNSIAWARDEGYPNHPDWYHGLTPATATLADWQMFA